MPAADTSPAAKKSDTRPAPGAVAMRSPAGLELLGRARIVGWPTVATPWNTVSTKLGLALVPNLALKIWMQFGPHCGVAALAERVPTVLRPPTMVSIAATASTFLLMDITSSVLEPRPYPAHGGGAGTGFRARARRRPRVPRRERPFLPGRTSFHKASRRLDLVTPPSLLVSPARRPRVVPGLPPGLLP